MSARIVYSIIFLFVFIISCELYANDYLTISSIDNKQSVKIEMDKIKVYDHYKLDIPAIMSKMRAYKFNIFKLDEYLIKLSDSESSFVFFTENKKREKEGEVSVFLLGLYDRGLKELYYIEHEQGKWFWKMNNGIMEIDKDKNNEIEIVAKLESINFSLSGFIDFPYNKEGGYDKENRHLKINGEWHR